MVAVCQLDLGQRVSNLSMQPCMHPTSMPTGGGILEVDGHHAKKFKWGVLTPPHPKKGSRTPK
jgi:hypothetical protein